MSSGLASPHGRPFVVSFGVYAWRIRERELLRSCNSSGTCRKLARARVDARARHDVYLRVAVSLAGEFNAVGSSATSESGHQLAQGERTSPRSQEFSRFAAVYSHRAYRDNSSPSLARALSSLSLSFLSRRRVSVF